jgi:RNA recognition motif-containing protein
LHVRNLHPTITEDDLKELFSFDDLHIERVKRLRDFAFIHYQTREEAENALKLVQCKPYLKLKFNIQLILFDNPFDSEIIC